MPFIRFRKLVYDDSGQIVSGTAAIVDVKYVPGEAKAETPEDAWMFSRLAHAVASCTEQLIAYNFGDYARDMQGFFWNEGVQRRRDFSI